MGVPLLVDPSKLETLAKAQESAKKDAESAANDLNGTGGNCWLNHGVISGCSNGAFDTIEGVRKTAGLALGNASLKMAAKLRTAKLAYEGVDSELGTNLNKQMLDK
jgi:Excreted virulence factor EspC, type VII ESX diderm